MGILHCFHLRFLNQGHVAMLVGAVALMAPGCATQAEDADSNASADTVSPLPHGDAPFAPLQALGGCDVQRDIGILGTPQWGSWLITGPNIPRDANGRGIAPAQVVGAGCAALTRTTLVTAPPDWEGAETISTCDTPVSLRYVSPATLVRPKTAAPSSHWMWGCKERPVNRRVLGAAAGCTHDNQKTKAFECVNPRSVVANFSVDARLVTQVATNPYAFVCESIVEKDVCLAPSATSTPITP